MENKNKTNATQAKNQAGLDSFLKKQQQKVAGSQPDTPMPPELQKIAGRVLNPNDPPMSEHFSAEQIMDIYQRTGWLITKKHTRTVIDQLEDIRKLFEPFKGANPLATNICGLLSATIECILLIQTTADHEANKP